MSHIYAKLINGVEPELNLHENRFEEMLFGNFRNYFSFLLCF